MPREEKETFPKAKRGNLFPKHKQRVPSPWRYTPKQPYELLNQSKGYTIQGKNEKLSYIQKNETPGPGNYPPVQRFFIFLICIYFRF